MNNEPTSELIPCWQAFKLLEEGARDVERSCKPWNPMWFVISFPLGHVCKECQFRRKPKALMLWVNMHDFGYWCAYKDETEARQASKLARDATAQPAVVLTPEILAVLQKEGLV